MRFSCSWLCDYLDGVVPDPDVVVDALSRIGVEATLVDGFSSHSCLFVVVSIFEVLPHPSAGKLKICKVSDGISNFQIVCGASNVREGMLTVLARIGALIPKSGAVIEKVPIMGVESCGMLCSAYELGILPPGIEDSKIIDLLDTAYKVGEDFFPTGEQVIEISTTPNRGDCLGVYGIARELAAAGIGKLKSLPVVSLEVFGCSPINVEMRSAGALFMGRYIRSVRNKTSPPRWIRDRLLSAGVMSVSCIVDIVNYIMLAFNRPMHVYDSDKISGAKLVIEKSSGKSFAALNGKEYPLSQEDLVVVDDGGMVHCLAGIMGADYSRCGYETENIFLESAWYDPVSILLSSRRLKLSTDASYRFERFTDPELVKFSLDLATHMIVEHCGGSVSDFVVCGTGPSKIEGVELDSASVNAVGSTMIREEDACRILESLGFSVDISDSSLWRIKVPSWRYDIGCSVDIVEEVLRIHGYGQILEQEIPPSLPVTEKEKHFSSEKLRLAMLSLGLTEVMTWSFMSGVLAQKFGYDVETLRIANPISNQLDTMRPTMLPNLLQIVASNQACGRDRVAIFELGDVYVALDKSELVACGLRSGYDVPRNPHVGSRKFDFFDVKGDVLQVLLQLGIEEQELEFRVCDRCYLHPARSAEVYFQGVVCAHVGEIHPNFCDFFEIKHSVLYFEVFLSQVPKVDKDFKNSQFSINKYQATKRDFAFLLDKQKSAQFLLDVIRNIEYVEEATIFDVYEGGSIPEGKKSIAVSVVMVSKTGTMTEREINAVSDGVIALVSEKLGGRLRVEE